MRLPAGVALLGLLGVMAASYGVRPPTNPGDGLVVARSNHSMAATTERARTEIERRGLKIMAAVDHAANAAGVGLELPPTTLFIFGNPKVGSRLIACGQEAAIDLPLKLLVWQDSADAVWVGYNDPQWIARRHGLTGCDDVAAGMHRALAAIVDAVTD